MTSACRKAVGQNHAIFGGVGTLLFVDDDHDVVEVADSLDHLAEDCHVGNHHVLGCSCSQPPANLVDRLKV